MDNVIEILRNREFLERLLFESIEIFNKSSDLVLLHGKICKKHDGPAKSERSIAHRFALYLESSLRRMVGINQDEEMGIDGAKIAVDTDYDKHGTGSKCLASREMVAFLNEAISKAKVGQRRRLRALLNKPNAQIITIPDIIVHERQVDTNNLIVLEVKKASNPNGITKDYDKVKGFTISNESPSNYRYVLGAILMVNDKHTKNNERKLQVSKLFYGA